MSLVRLGVIVRLRRLKSRSHDAEFGHTANKRRAMRLRGDSGPLAFAIERQKRSGSSGVGDIYIIAISEMIYC